jgi:hypothetical protein
MDVGFTNPAAESLLRRAMASEIAFRIFLVLSSKWTMHNPSSSVRLPTEAALVSTLMNKTFTIAAMIGAIVAASGSVPARAGVVTFAWDPSQAAPGLVNAPTAFSASEHLPVGPARRANPHAPAACQSADCPKVCL